VGKVSCASMSALADQIGAFNGLISGLGIVERAYEWVSSDARKGWTWQKYTGQSFATVTNLVDTTLFLGKIKVLRLGAVVPFLDLVKNFSTIPACIFNIWHTSLEMKKSDELIQKTEAKRQKWEARQFAYTNVLNEANTENALKNAFKKQFEDKIDQIQANYNAATPNSPEQEKLEQKLRKWQRYYAEVNASGIADSDSYDADMQTKVEGYTAISEAARKKAGIEKTKAILSIINQIMKVALCALAVVAFFTGIATTVAVMGTLAACWAATHGLGVAKEMYGVYSQARLDQLKLQVSLKPHSAKA
jgi:hypothetical protein